MNEKDRLSLFMAIREMLYGRFRQVKARHGGITWLPGRDCYQFTVTGVGTGADARYAADRIKDLVTSSGYDVIRLKYRPQVSGHATLMFLIAHKMPGEVLPMRWQACSFSPVVEGVEMPSRFGMARVEHFGQHGYTKFVDGDTGECYSLANRVTLFDGPGSYIEHTRETVATVTQPKFCISPPTSLVLTGVYRNMTKWMRRTLISSPLNRQYKAELRRLIDLEVRKMDPIPAIPWPTIWRRLTQHYRSPPGRKRYISARSWLNQFEKILNEYVTLEKLLPRSVE